MRLLSPILRRRAPFYIFTILTFGRYASAWNRQICNNTIVTMLQNGTLNSTDNTTFYTNDTGFIMSNPDYPVLTLDGCERFCGAKKDWYPDAGPRLNTWLIPVVLLIANMEVSPLDKRRYWMVVHLLGDPVDSLWSLLSKVEAWSRCYNLARFDYRRGIRSTPKVSDVQILATVLAGIEELLGPQVNPLSVFDTLIPQNARESLSIQVSKTAFKLADSRTDELIRTLFAVALYLYQVIAAFFSVLGGGNTSPPGGRIGTAMFITWLVPIILLSNAVGGFTSRTSCFDTMRDLCAEVPARPHQLESLLTQRISQSAEYLESQSYSGSIYTFIHDKRISFSGRSHDHSQFHLLLVALAPLINASVFGSIIILNTPPGGLNCRNIMVIVMTLLWLLSTLLTWCISRAESLEPKDRWYLILAKDTIIAIPSLLIIFLSSAGVFNSCRCWSGIYSLGAKAHIPLNTNAFFDYNDTHLYPILVIVCLGMQFAIFGYIIFIGRRGLRTMRWTGEEKRDFH